jgi:hypothetical protein
MYLTVRPGGGAHDGLKFFKPSESRLEPRNPTKTLRHHVHGPVDGMDAVVERIARPRQRHPDDDLRHGGGLCLVSRHALAISAQRPALAG